MRLRSYSGTRTSSRMQIDAKGPSLESTDFCVKNMRDQLAREFLTRENERRAEGRKTTTTAILEGLYLVSHKRSGP
jgi:hypothetical protein